MSTAAGNMAPAGIRICPRNYFGKYNTNHENSLRIAHKFDIFREGAHGLVKSSKQTPVWESENILAVREAAWRTSSPGNGNNIALECLCCPCFSPVQPSALIELMASSISLCKWKQKLFFTACWKKCSLGPFGHLPMCITEE
jgi:hypothetical protein